MADYAPSSFYCEASDKKGHGRQIRVHPESHGRVSILVNDAALPYRTQEDFVRDAVVHRWQWLSDNEDNPLIKQESARLSAQAELDRQRGIVDAERVLVDSLKVSINDPDKRLMLSRGQIDKTLASFVIPSMRDAAERLVVGLSFES